ncbi:MAG: hypothetical protein ABJJ69_06840 [Paracoccaceae bacterium]
MASEKAPAVWDEQLAAWHARLSGQGADAAKHFEAVQSLAASKSFGYLPIDQVAQLPLEKLLDRIDAIPILTGAFEHLQKPTRLLVWV